MENKIEKLKELALAKNIKAFKELFKTLDQEELQELENEETYKNTNNHEYTGYNLYFLSFLKEPWIFWTFAQWRKEKKSIKKWAKWVPLLAPIFEKDENGKDQVKFFKQIFVFHENDTQKA